MNCQDSDEDGVAKITEEWTPATSRTEDIEPPIDPDIDLAGFSWVAMPIDLLNDTWALELSNEELGVMQRLMHASLRQSPPGSLPGSFVLISKLVPDIINTVFEKLEIHWVLASDGRRYWQRLVPIIEDAWSRRRGSSSKDATRKRLARIGAKLEQAGLPEQAASMRETRETVSSELNAIGASRITIQAVRTAAINLGYLSD